MKYVLFFSALLSLMVKADCPLVYPLTDIHVCAGGTAIFSPVVEGKFRRIEWTGGKNEVEDKGQYMYEYTPPENEKDEVILTLIATPEGSCPVQRQTVKVIIDQMPEASINDLRLCDGEPIRMQPEIKTAYDSLRWSTSGTGSFEQPESPATAYFPSKKDVRSDGLLLTLKMYRGVCPAVENSMRLIIDEKPDFKIDTVSINGGLRITGKGVPGLKVTWKTDGKGSLKSDGYTAFYTPKKGEETVNILMIVGNIHGCLETFSILATLNNP